MKVWQKNIISVIKDKMSKVYESSGQYTKYQNMITKIKNDDITSVPKNILKTAQMDSKSKYTQDKIKSYNEVKHYRDKVGYYLNKNNLVIKTKDNAGNEQIFEKKLESNKYSFNKLNKMAQDAVNSVNLQYSGRYKNQIVSISDFYILERYY